MVGGSLGLWLGLVAWVVGLHVNEAKVTAGLAQESNPLNPQLLPHVLFSRSCCVSWFVATYSIIWQYSNIGIG